ncbi:MAG TPA: phospholipase D family protein [Terracidiphilus sp.]|nr:phospholipase D family protein [Terracidiphilus sp.]
MSNLYSNGPNKDFVIQPYQKHIAGTHSLFVASPFVTLTDDLAIAANQGKSVCLLVGLNIATNPAALRAIFGIPNLAIRYYTHRFHAKIFLFDSCALIGSSNLTDGGMQSNREATILVDDPDQVAEVRALCQELWSSAPVLTPEVLKRFEGSVTFYGQYFDPNTKVEAAVGRAEPANISVGSKKKSSEYIFLEGLRRRVYEQFRPAFDEVSAVLSENNLHRPEWSNSDNGSKTNRFLNWVRLAHGSGDDWQTCPPRSQEDRRLELLRLGDEWKYTDKPQIPKDYFTNLEHLRAVFASRESLMSASRVDLSTALMGIHAFEEQIRFIKGGYAAIIDYFWKQNQDDIERVKRSLSHLLFDKDEFIRRLYDVLYFSEWKISHFGESCALELSGTVRPEMCPPMNGRSAKGLRCIGFTVPASA